MSNKRAVYVTTTKNSNNKRHQQQHDVKRVTFGPAISQDGPVYRKCAVRLGKVEVDDKVCDKYKQPPHSTKKKKTKA